MEKTTSVDQKLAAVEQLVASRPDTFARQGVVVATWRRVGQQRLGPYYSLRFRDGRRQQSLYLGSSRELAEQVRRLLAQLQRPHRERRGLERSRAAVKASLHSHKESWRRELETVGLTLKGFEIRGWKRLKAVVTGN